MSKQKVIFNTEARQKLKDGIKVLADAVSSTLGPAGRNVIFKKDGKIQTTKDGVSVAKRFEELEDAAANLGMEMLKQASIQTGNKAGDGTTTATLLAYSLVSQALDAIYKNNNINVTSLKRHMEDFVDQVISYLDEIKEDINGEDQLRQIAFISGNNDEEIGEIVSQAINEVGLEGAVHVENSNSGETYLDTVEGIQFDRGWISPYFVTNNESMTSVLDNPLILITNMKISTSKDLLPILNQVAAENRSLLIIGDSIDNEALGTLILNKSRGTIKVAAVRAPEFGDRRTLLLEDIAILTGGTVIDPDKGLTLKQLQNTHFGKAKTVTVSKDTTTIIDGGGEEEAISTRVDQITQQILKAESSFEKQKLQDRLAKMSGGVCIIYVGGNTETEMLERKDRIDDALNATKAALEDGILPGGGNALAYSAEKLMELGCNDYEMTLAKDIVIKACEAPRVKIFGNAHSDEDINFPSCITSPWEGYDIKLWGIINLKERGIIDPAKVTKTALRNAMSVAGNILLTEAIITDIPEENNQFDPSSMMGMM